MYESPTIENVMDRFGCTLEVAECAIRGFNNFLQWERDTQVSILHHEVPLVDDELEFGGCLDGVGPNSRNQTSLFDYKTSDRVFVDNLLQLSAYAHLWNLNTPSDPITGGYHLCRFSRTYGDFSHHYWDNLDDAFEMFLLLRKSYELDKKLKKRTG